MLALSRGGVAIRRTTIALGTLLAMAWLAAPAAAQPASAAQEGGLADLRLTGWAFATYSCARLAGIEADVMNQGTVDAGGFSVQFLVDGHVFSAARTSGLAVGHGHVVWIAEWPFRQDGPGQHTFEVRVDPQNRVAESDETNQGTVQPFTC
jgi:hypothetical protein